MGEGERARIALAALSAMALASTACQRFQIGEDDESDSGPGVLVADAGDAADAAVDAMPADAGGCPTRHGASVVEVDVGGTGNQATAPARAEGPPDCGIGGGGSRSLSLGGGHIVLDIGCLYDPGASADLRVWEAANSYPPCYGVAEAFDVEVSADGVDYTGLGEGQGPTAFDASDFGSFRFVRISDPTTPDDSITPGPDIDALELLHAP